MLLLIMSLSSKHWNINIMLLLMMMCVMYFTVQCVCTCFMCVCGTARHGLGRLSPHKMSLSPHGETYWSRIRRWILIVSAVKIIRAPASLNYTPRWIFLALPVMCVSVIWTCTVWTYMAVTVWLGHNDVLSFCGIHKLVHHLVCWTINGIGVGTGAEGWGRWLFCLREPNITVASTFEKCHHSHKL